MNNIETLKTKRTELEKNAEELQLKNAEHQFQLDLEDRKVIKTIIEHLDKGYTWKTQNAAVVVTLHDRLKQQYKDLSDSEEAIVSLKAYELNGLYQALLAVEGTGVESARRFIRMLTLVGEAVTNAMKTLGEMNAEIQNAHLELSEVDQQIAELESNQSENVEPELEVTTESSN